MTNSILNQSIRKIPLRIFPEKKIPFTGFSQQHLFFEKRSAAAADFEEAEADLSAKASSKSAIGISRKAKSILQLRLRIAMQSDEFA